MKRVLALAGSLLLVTLVAAPAVLADDGDVVDTDRVVVAIQGDVGLPVGEQAAAVVVIDGNALIEGMANTVTVVDGTATLRGATVRTLTIISGHATLEAGTTITGDVVQLNSTVDQAAGVTIGGSVRSLAESMAGFALFVGVAAILFWIGIAVATLVAGLALAAFGARQVRATEATISNEPLKVFVVGLLMILIPPVVFVLLAITVVGLPLGLGMLLFAWPAMAFVGYLVAAIWIGDWILRAANIRRAAERPYLAAVVGLIATAILGIIPLVTAIVSIFGLGGVTLAAWRVMVGGSTAAPAYQPTQAPVQG